MGNPDPDDDEGEYSDEAAQEAYNFVLAAENELLNAFIRVRDHFIDEYYLSHNDVIAQLLRAIDETRAIHDWELDVEAGILEEFDDEEEDEDELEDWQKE